MLLVYGIEPINQDFVIFFIFHVEENATYFFSLMITIERDIVYKMKLASCAYYFLTLVNVIFSDLEYLRYSFEETFRSSVCFTFFWIFSFYFLDSLNVIYYFAFASCTLFEYSY